MRAAKGDYIALLDSDDEWLPAKLERQVERMEAVSDDTGVCFCGGSIVKNGDMTKPVPYVPSRTWEHDTFRKYVLGKILFLTSTILFRSICLRKTGLMVAEMRRNQDGEFLLRLLGHFGLCLVPEPYAIWHVAVGPGCNHYGAMVAALPFHLRHRELIRSKLGHWPATHYSCNLRTNILCAAIREGRWRRAGEELWHRWRECPLPLPRDVKMVSRAVLAGGLANLRGYHGERR
jgi:glycosyltransferase involved in cell wall biosynthesis